MIPLIPIPNSPHYHPDSPHSHPYSPHSHPDSPYFYHSYPDSPHFHNPHLDSQQSDHSPHSVPRFPISAFTDSRKFLFLKIKKSVKIVQGLSNLLQNTDKFQKLMQSPVEYLRWRLHCTKNEVFP